MIKPEGVRAGQGGPYGRIEAMRVLRPGDGRLLSAAALPLAAVLVTVLTSVDVMAHGPLRRFDDWVFAGGLPQRSGAWFWFWRTVVNGGQYWLVGSIAAITAVIVAWRRRSFWLLVRAGLWLVGTELAIRAMQVGYGRTPPRTGVDLLYVEGYLSYPSGHAANSAACLIFVAAVAGASRGATIAVHVLVVGVCVATVALGYHWPTDSIAGWGLGIVLAAIGRFVVSPESVRGYGDDGYGRGHSARPLT